MQNQDIQNRNMQTQASEVDTGVEMGAPSVVVAGLEKPKLVKVVRHKMRLPNRFSIQSNSN